MSGKRRMSTAELRALAQPAEVMGRRNSEHWAGALYLRRLSIYVTRALLPTRISANGVTWLMITSGVAGAVVLIWTSWWAVLACAVLMQVQILFDCSDGEVARLRATTSPAGVYLDRLGHYLTEALLPIGVGVHADGGVSSIGGWTLLGALTSVVVVLNKSFTDLVHVARAYGGLPLLSEDAGLAAVRVGLLRRVRVAMTRLPLFRAFVAIEFSLITLVVATIDLSVGRNDVLRGWAIAMLPLAAFVASGHLVAVLLSRRLTG